MKVSPQANAWMNMGMLFSLMSFLLALIAIWTTSPRGVYTALAFTAMSWTMFLFGLGLQWAHAKADSRD